MAVLVWRDRGGCRVRRVGHRLGHVLRAARRERHDHIAGEHRRRQQLVQQWQRAELPVLRAARGKRDLACERQRGGRHQRHRYRRRLQPRRHRPLRLWRAVRRRRAQSWRHRRGARAQRRAAGVRLPQRGAGGRGGHRHLQLRPGRAARRGGHEPVRRRVLHAAARVARVPPPHRPCTCRRCHCCDSCHRHPMAALLCCGRPLSLPRHASSGACTRAIRAIGQLGQGHWAMGNWTLRRSGRYTCSFTCSCTCTCTCADARLDTVAGWLQAGRTATRPGTT